MTPIKLMLACKAEVEDVVFPCYVSPKIDGIRAYWKDGVFYSRNNKLIRNLEAQKYAQSMPAMYTGRILDGELTVGSLNAPNVFARTQAIMGDQPLNNELTYWVFDEVGTQKVFTARYEGLTHRLTHGFITDLRALRRELESFLAEGYEGIMVRSPDAVYKHGRSTVKEQALLKIKPTEDHEAVVVGFDPIDSEVKTGLGMLHVKNEFGEFSIGSGFTQKQRDEFWELDVKLIGRLVTYTHAKGFPLRFPVFKGFREDI